MGLRRPTTIWPITTTRDHSHDQASGPTAHGALDVGLGADHETGPAAGGPVSTLRGAEVQVDGRKILPVLVGAVLVTLAVLVVAFAVAGFHKNAQIDRLKQDGVGVSVTVTNCQGLLGGSGSNLVGYSCTGTYTLKGHRYSERLPGTSGYTANSTVRAVAVPGDPALVSPVETLRGEQASDGVFALPAALLAVFVAVVLLLIRRTTRNDPSGRRKTA